MSTTANRDFERVNVPIIDLDRQRDPDGQPLNAQRLALARLLADGSEWEFPALRNAIASDTGTKLDTIKKTIVRTKWVTIDGGSGRRASRVRLAPGVVVVGANASAPTPPLADEAPLFAGLEPPITPINQSPATITGDGTGTDAASLPAMRDAIANLYRAIDQLHEMRSAQEPDWPPLHTTLEVTLKTLGEQWAEQRQREMDVVRGELAESRRQTAALAEQVEHLKIALAQWRPPSAKPVEKSATKRKPPKHKSAEKIKQRKPQAKSKPNQKPPQKPKTPVDLNQRIVATVRRLAGADGWADNAAVRDALGCNASNWSRKVQRAIAAKLIQRRQKGAGFQLRAVGRPSSA